MEGDSKISLQWGIQVPMRDGIRLSATLYLPRDHSVPAPCAVTLTPYIADALHQRGMYFAAHGLVFLIVDSRGRGNSEGVFRPYIQEATDGADIIGWVAQQPYCDGKVGMCGGSYNGYSQWATATQLPRSLATIIPAASPFMGIDFPMRSNIFYPFIIQWLALTAGRTGQDVIFSDRKFWSFVFSAWHRSGRPFEAITDFLSDGSGRMRSSVVKEWLSHPEPDEFWDAYNPTDHQYASMHLPILTITGIYDDDQPGALEHYKRHMRSRSKHGRVNHFLVIGPWDHAGTRAPKAEFGGLSHGPESLVDLQKLQLEWFEWVMRGGSKPTFLREPVAYYVTGADRWKYAETLESVTSHHWELHFDSTHNANGVYRSGRLTPTLGRGGPDSYTYDPRVVEGREVTAEENADGGSLVDQSVLLALDAKCLVYQSAPFAEETEISGFFRLSAWIAIDCPDTDIYVSVHELLSDGLSVRLSTDAMRARYRQGLRSPSLIGTREPLLYEFARFTWVSRQVRRGSRLRLVFAPMGRLVETTFAQKNYNGGGVVSEESSTQGRAVTVKLFHDETHRSILYVPIATKLAATDAMATMP